MKSIEAIRQHLDRWQQTTRDARAAIAEDMQRLRAGTLVEGELDLDYEYLRYAQARVDVLTWVLEEKP